jgi:hypothetical protein
MRSAIAVGQPDPGRKGPTFAENTFRQASRQVWLDRELGVYAAMSLCVCITKDGLLSGLR